MAADHGEIRQHDACPSTWCWMLACDACGEMLTNPQPKDDGFVGICPTCGRGAKAVRMNRADCLVAPAVSGSQEQDR